MSWELFEVIDCPEYMRAPATPAHRILRRRFSTDRIMSVDEPTVDGVRWVRAYGYEGDFCSLAIDGMSPWPYVKGRAVDVAARLNVLDAERRLP